MQVAQIPISDKEREIAARLRVARTHFGLSQAAWAEALEVKRQHVIDIERQKARPTEELQGRVVGRFGVSGRWLADGVGEMLLDESSSLGARLERLGKAVRASTDAATEVGGDRTQLQAVQEAAYGIYRKGAVTPGVPYTLDTARLSTALMRVERFAPRGDGALSTSTRARLIAALYELPGDPAGVTDAAIQAVLDVGLP